MKVDGSPGATEWRALEDPHYLCCFSLVECLSLVSKVEPCSPSGSLLCVISTEKPPVSLRCNLIGLCHSSKALRVFTLGKSSVLQDPSCVGSAQPSCETKGPILSKALISESSPYNRFFQRICFSLLCLERNLAFFSREK